MKFQQYTVTDHERPTLATACWMSERWNYPIQVNVQDEYSHSHTTVGREPMPAHMDIWESRKHLANGHRGLKASQSHPSMMQLRPGNTTLANLGDLVTCDGGALRTVEQKSRSPREGL